MTKLLITIVLGVAILGGIGFVILGAFPQHMTRTQVDRTIPADHLGHN